MFWLEGSNGKYKIAKYSITNKKYNTFKVSGLDSINAMVLDTKETVFYFTDGQSVSSIIYPEYILKLLREILIAVALRCIDSLSLNPPSDKVEAIL